MSRVLVTGGAGFIGHHLGAMLTEVGWDVVHLDVLNPQVHQDLESSRARLVGTLIEGDVTDDAVLAALPEVDAVVHLAAETGVGQSMYETERYRFVNVEGTRKIAELVGERRIPLVFFSSRAVYGEGRWVCGDHGEHFGPPCCESAAPAASRESDPCMPVSVYGETKVDGESLLARGACGDAPFCVVRPQNVIGAGQALHNPYTGVLAAFLARLRDAKPIQVYGDGHQTRDFIHVTDVARSVVALLERPGGFESGLVVNCGTGVRTSLLELAQYAIDGAPVDGTIEHVEVNRAGDIEHACADLTRFTEAGLPAPVIDAAAAVADFIRSGWEAPRVSSSVWDRALAELEDKGLAS